MNKQNLSDFFNKNAKSNFFLILKVFTELTRLILVRQESTRRIPVDSGKIDLNHKKEKVSDKTKCCK